jgi:Skp1 family, tetramerisation domain
MADDQKPSEYVTLVSNDGYTFVIEREAAYQSGTLKRMLGHGSELPLLHKYL